MSEPDPKKEPEKKPDDAPGKADLAALGIGCLVVIIFFVAIVMVAIKRGE